MKFNKLVRDKIPEIIAADGKKAVTRILTDEEYKIYLEKKLDEEVAEFHESKSIEELADILAVVYALSEVDNTIYNLLAVWNEKTVNCGGFTKKILLEEICEEGEDNEQREAD